MNFVPGLSFEIISHHVSVVLGFLLATLFAARLMKEERPQGSTIAWLLVIILFPYIGVPLYILFGGTRLKKIGLISSKKNNSIYEEHQKIISSHTKSFPSVSYPISEVLIKNGASPLRTNNTISFFSDGQSIYSQLMQAFDTAKKSIHIGVFIFGNDAIGKEILNILIKKKREGVEVYILVDGLGSIKARWGILRKLPQYKIPLGVYMKLLPIHKAWSFNIRNHRKIIIIDDQRAFMGGMNLAQEYMGPHFDSSRWVDIMIQIEHGPIVLDLKSIFVLDWHFATGQLLPLYSGDDLNVSIHSKESTVHQSEIQIVSSGVYTDRDPFYHGLITMLHEAKKNITIVTPYFIPDEILMNELALQSRLGKDIKVILPETSNHTVADIGRGSFIRKLKKSGVKFLGYKKSMLHAKIILVDDKIGLVGSANLDIRSLHLNYEIGMFIYTQHDILTLTQIVQTIESQSSFLPSSSQFFTMWFEDAFRLVAPLL